MWIHFKFYKSTDEAEMCMGINTDQWQGYSCKYDNE